MLVVLSGMIVRDILKIDDSSQKSGPIKCQIKKEILKIQTQRDLTIRQHDFWNTLQFHEY